MLRTSGFVDDVTFSRHWQTALTHVATYFVHYISSSLPGGGTRAKSDVYDWLVCRAVADVDDSLVDADDLQAECFVFCTLLLDINVMRWLDWHCWFIIQQSFIQLVGKGWTVWLWQMYTTDSFLVYMCFCVCDSLVTYGTIQTLLFGF